MRGPDKIKTLEMRISILKDKITEQATTYDKMQNKMFAIVGLLLTIGGLLTYDVFKISFPNTTLEWIVFVAALALLGISAALIGYDYRTKREWSVPIGAADDARLDNAKNYEEALEYIHKDYQAVYRDRDASLGKKAWYLNTSLYSFIGGVILVIVLKIGG